MFICTLRHLFVCFLRGLKSTSASTAANNCGNHLKGENASYMYDHINVWCPSGIFMFRFHVCRVISGMMNTREQINAIPWMPYKHDLFFGMNFLLLKPYELCCCKRSGIWRILHPVLLRSTLNLLKMPVAVHSKLGICLAGSFAGQNSIDGIKSEEHQKWTFLLEMFPLSVTCIPLACNYYTENKLSLNILRIQISLSQFCCKVTVKCRKGLCLLWVCGWLKGASPVLWRQHIPAKWLFGLRLGKM